MAAMRAKCKQFLNKRHADDTKTVKRALLVLYSVLCIFLIGPA